MIRVTVRNDTPHDVHHGVAVLKELREAGVPVVGALWPRAVEHGVLTLTGNTYEWTPDPAREEELF
jgi:formylglycine-generating enzyme required for sulfatase activity